MDYDWQVELPKAVREIPREELERYVRVFEDKPRKLKRACSMCALGAMAGVHELPATPGADLLLTDRYLRYVGWREQALRARRDARSRGQRPTYPYQVVEDVFEGWLYTNPSDPRLAIYEACVEELARRDSEDWAPPYEPAAMVGAV